MKNEIIIGDCAEVLKQLPDESIDCIVTDPPYGYSFMGLQWDKALPSLEALKECCRVLKSGAFAFFMCAPRQDVLSRMIIRLEDAGFNVNFSSIYFCYASGFPKSAAMDKLIDRRRDDRQGVLNVSKWLNSKIKESSVKYSEILSFFGFNEGSGQIGHWTATSIGAQPTVPTWEQWLKLKDFLNLPPDMDNEVWRLNGRKGKPGDAFFEREVIGKGECGDPTKWYEGNECKKLEYDITAPATDKAREFSGAFAGNQLKPALECIIVCMKNLSEKTYVDQALQNGHGVTWLDSVRIPYESNESNSTTERYKTSINNSQNKIYNKKGDLAPEIKEEVGRFPANLLCSDNCLDNGIITKSRAGIRHNNSILGVNTKDDTTTLGLGDAYSSCNDSGDFSRYFSLDAWFDKKLQELPEEQQKTFPFLIVPKPSKSEKNKYIENKHPTVKPLKLMSYLITMGSREGDVILDPFAGSGTTLEACKLLNRVFIGIDKDPENEKYMMARGQMNKTTLESFQEIKV